MRRVTSEAAGRVSASRPQRGKQLSSPVIESITANPPRPGHTLLEIGWSAVIKPTIADQRPKTSPARAWKPLPSRTDSPKASPPTDNNGCSSSCLFTEADHQERFQSGSGERSEERRVGK